MSIRLVVEVLDHAPADLAASELVLLIVLAESARDDTRECWPGMPVLTRRTRLSARRVREVLAELAQRGCEVRVSSGVDRHGKPVFATKGHRTVYRVPAFRQRGPDSASFKAAEPRPLSDAKAAESGTQRRRKPVAKAAESRPPSPHEPSREPSNQGARAEEITAVIQALRDRTGRTVNEHHAGLVVDQLLGGRRGEIRTTAVRYLIGAIHNDADPGRFMPTPGPPHVRELIAAMNSRNPQPKRIE